MVANKDRHKDIQAYRKKDTAFDKYNPLSRTRKYVNHNSIITAIEMMLKL